MNQPTPTPAASLPDESARVSETPRTDKEADLAFWQDNGDEPFIAVPADFARTLETALRTAEARRVEAEREVAKAREWAKEFSQEHYAQGQEVSALRERNAGLVKALERWLKVYTDCMEEQQDTGHSDYNITVGLVCDTRTALTAAPCAIETDTFGTDSDFFVVGEDGRTFRGKSHREALAAALSAAPTRRDVGVTG